MYKQSVSGAQTQKTFRVMQQAPLPFPSARAREDWFRWAFDGGLYVSQEDLCVALRSVASTSGDQQQQQQHESGQETGEHEDSWCAADVVVIDTRDDDRAGGHIRGSLHAPDASFDAESVVSEARKFAAGQSQQQAKLCLVFHCMESARRGPRCARRTFEYLCQQKGLDPRFVLPTASLAGVTLRVLRGGFDQWCRRFYRDVDLVEGFDDDYWGWGSSSDAEADEGDHSLTPAAHTLYQRPVDQPATPWSGSGGSPPNKGAIAESVVAKLRNEVRNAPPEQEGTPSDSTLTGP
jgi:rhodanese-related sulfurtransferase